MPRDARTPAPARPLALARTCARGRALVVALACIVGALFVAPSAQAAMAFTKAPRTYTTTGEVTVTWRTSSPGTSELRWGTAADPWAALPNDHSDTTVDLTSHARAIHDLRPGTYYFRVRTVGLGGTVTSGAHRIVIDEASTPGTTLTTDGAILTSQTGADGSTLHVGGTFTKFGRPIGTTGVVDPATGAITSTGQPRVQGTAQATLSDGAGGWYLCGFMSKVGGVEPGTLVHVLPDGGIDPDFRFTLNNYGPIFLTSDKIYMLLSTQLDVIDRTTGALLNSIDLQTDGWANKAEIDEGNNLIYLGGNFTTIGGQPRTNVAALDLTTGLATPFPVGASDAPVTALELDGTTLYVGGNFTTLLGASRTRLGAIDLTTGTLTAWNPGLSGGSNPAPMSIAAAGGNVYVSGRFNTLGGAPRNAVGAIDASSGAATTWNPQPTSKGWPASWVSSLQIVGSTVYVAGGFDTIGGAARSGIAALDTTLPTNNATSFDAPIFARVPYQGTVTVGPSSILVTSVSGLVRTEASRAGLAAIDTSTDTLTAWNPGVADGSDPGSVASMVLDPTGATAYVGGTFTSLGGAPRARIGAVPTSSNTATAWNPGASSSVLALALDPTGTTIYAGGSFTTLGGASRARIGAVPTASDTATAWNPGADNVVQALTLDAAATTVYAGGFFTTLGGAARASVGAVPVVSDTASAWNPGTNGVVNTITTDGASVYIGGNFTTIGGAARTHVGRVPSGSNTADAWNASLTDSGSSSNVSAVRRIGSYVYLGGAFIALTGNAEMLRVDEATGTPRARLNGSRGSGYFGVRTWAEVGPDLWGTGDSGVFRIRGRSDESGNAGANPMAFTRVPRVDVNDHQVTVTWQTNLSGSSEVVWNKQQRPNAYSTDWFDHGRSASRPEATLGTSHSRTISNLSQGTYEYCVRSRSDPEQVTSCGNFSVESPAASSPLGATVVDGSVRATAFSPDGGTLYVGGRFSSVGTRSGTGLVTRASTGAAYAGAPQVSSTVYTAVPDGSGGYYIGGAFRSVGGVTRHHLAHLLPDGGVDPDFDIAVSGVVIALQRVGTTLYLGGDFTAVGGAARARVAAIDLTDNSVTGFAPQVTDGDVRSIAVGTGVVYVSGTFHDVAGQTRGGLAALDTTTGAPTAFRADVDTWISDIAFDGSHLYASGGFSTIDGVARPYLAQLDPATGAPTTWSAGADAAVRTLELDGATLYAGGDFANLGGAARARIGAVATASGAATAFAVGASGSVYDLDVEGATLYVGGDFDLLGASARRNAGAVTIATNTVTSFDPDPAKSVQVVSPSGADVFVGGDFTSVGGVTRHNLAAIDVTMGTPTSWNPGADREIEAIATAPGVVYVGGEFGIAAGQGRSRIAALDPATGAATPWNPGSDGPVHALLADGSDVIAAGHFTTIGSAPRANLARIDGASGAATGWNPGTGAPDHVYDLERDGSDLYVAGNITSLGGSARTGVGAVDATSGAVRAYAPAVAGQVHDIAIDGSTLYAGGAFTSFGGQPRTNLAASDTGTGATTGWQPDPNQQVDAVTLAGSRVLVGGWFTSISGTDQWRFASLDASTGAAASLGFRPNLAVSTIAVSGTLVYAGGGFNSFAADSIAQGGLALVSTCDRRTLCTDEVLQDFISVSVDDPFPAMHALPGDSDTGTTDVTVTSSGDEGYTMTLATESDTAALRCVDRCGSAAIPPFTTSYHAPEFGLLPVTWDQSSAASSDFGLGFTVLSTSSGRSPVWGTGTDPDDASTLKYSGILRSYALTAVRTSSAFGAPDTTRIGWRMRVPPAQAPGEYQGRVNIMVLPNA